MDRRSSKRENQGQPHEPRAYSQSIHHRPTDTTEQYMSEKSTRRPSYEERPQESHAKPDLSGDDDYVRRWLAQTGQVKAAESIRPKVRGKEAEHHTPRRRPELALRSFPKAALEADHAQQLSKRKRRHRSSSDSSLLEPIVKLKPKMKMRKEEETRPNELERREEPFSKLLKKRNIPSSDSGPSAAWNARQETFEKRDRYKTREDRYEPQSKKRKSDRLDKPDGERKSKKKRERKGDKKKESKKAGENLMNQFSSQSILQERLTIRPAHGPGLFNNGRASSPVQRRGVPDLVFSEMEFLQRPLRHPMPTDISRVTSKSREKDKRRASREQDEVSMFFKPPKQPLSETSPNARKERLSTYVSDGRSIYTKQGAMDQAKERSKSLDAPEKQYLGFGARARSSDIFPVFLGRTPSIQHPKGIPDTTSRLSEIATSGVTWSETQISPGATAASRRCGQEYRQHTSPTPEPIRISIENTGIFNGTRLGRSPALDSSRGHQHPSTERSHHGMVSHGVQTLVGDSDRTENQVNHKEILKAKASDRQFRHLESASRDQQVQPAREHDLEKSDAGNELGRSSGKFPNIIEECHIERKRSQIIVEHYDPDKGWHQQQRTSPPEKTETAPARDIAKVRESKSTPMTREEIAKNARVRRPATTLPVMRVPQEPFPHDKTHGGNPAGEVIAEDSTRRSEFTTLPLADKATPSVRRLDAHLSTSAVSPIYSKTQNTRPDIDIQQPNLSKDTHSEDPEVDQSIPAECERNPNTGEPAASIARPSSTRPEPARLEPTTIAGLPVRGPSLSRIGLSPRIHMSTVFGPAPLYFSQVQRQVVPEAPAFENNTRIDQNEDFWGTLYQDMTPYSDNIEYNVFGNQECEENGYTEHPIYEERGNYENSVEDVIGVPQVWQRMNHDEVQENYGTWERLGQDLGNGYEILGLELEDGYGSQALAGDYEVEERWVAYNNQLAGEELSMRGFWRSHRPY